MELNYFQEFKYREMFIDNKLTFKNHIKKIFRKISKSVDINKKISFFPCFILH